MRLAMIAVLGLAACMPDDGDRGEKGADECGAAALQHLVGQPVAPNEAEFETDNRPVRLIPPGTAVTMDHRPDRLNVDLDENDVITKIWCG